MKPARVSAAIAVATIAMAITTAIDAAATPPAQINAPMTTGGDVHPDLAVTPDGRRVVYRADQEADGRDELYARAVGGSAAVRLNDTLATGGDVRSFGITSNSQTIVYIADQDTDGRDELYAVRADRAAKPVVLSRDVVPINGDVRDFAISPDARRVVFRADGGTGTPIELYSRAIDGSSPTAKLNPTLVAGGDVRPTYQMTADSTRVVYVADQTTNDAFELYSVPVAGGGATRLNGDLTDGGDVQADFAVSPDSTRVVYRADAATDQLIELYSVPTGGGAAAVRISGDLAPAGLGTKLAVTPDSTRAVYVARTTAGARVELYSSRLDGSATQVQLNGPLVRDGDVGSFVIAPGPGPGLVLYRADQDIDGSWALYTRPADGSGVPTLVSGTPVAGREVRDRYAIAPDAQRFVYVEGPATGPLPHLLDLYSAPLAGGRIARLNDGAVGGGVMEERVSITPDSARVVYQAEQRTAGVRELFSRPIDGTGGSTTLNGPLTTGGDVLDHVLVPDSSGVVYRADQDVVDEQEAYLVAWAHPITRDDVGVVSAGATVDIDVLANDTIAAGALDAASLTVSIHPVSGTVSMLGGGTVRYTPDPGFTDAYDSFHYRVCAVDDPTLCGTAIVTIGIGDVPPPTTSTTTTTTTPPATTTPPTTTTPPPTTAPAKPPTTTTPRPSTRPTTTTSTPTGPTARPAALPKAGYWLLEADGDIQAFGAAPVLPSIGPDLAAGATAVAMAAHPDGKGLWALTSDGDIVARGSARDLGRVDTSQLTRPGEIVSTMSATPDGGGLWVFTSAGRIIPFGSALPAEQMAGAGAVLAADLDGPIVDSVATPSGRGAYMVGSDGGVFAVGDARFVDSVRGVLSAVNGPPGLPDQPVVGLVPDSDGTGYWNVAADGGVFGFQAAFRGSLPALIRFDQLVAPINGMVPYGNGYLLVAGDGGVFNFSDLPFAGSASGTVDSSVVDIATLG